MHPLRRDLAMSLPTALATNQTDPTDVQPRDVLVRVRDLSKTFVLGKSLIRQMLGRRPAYLRALDRVNLDVRRGEALGLVGESGCGKTTLGRCLLRLVEPDQGQVLYEGKDILQMRGSALRQMRRHMQIVFQDPYSSLNPRLTIRQTIAEACLVHHICTTREVHNRVDELLGMVGLSSKDVADRLPHELSGGQRQRVGLARALAVEPRFIVADEPVSALDVSIQAQVVNLLTDLQQRLHLTLLFITHDLRLVRYVSHRVVVMYLGRVVEVASADALFEEPAHPYTRALLAAAPNMDPRQRRTAPAISGEPPSPIDLPSGCPFRLRCPLATGICATEEPPLRPWTGSDHVVACHNV
jgi:oligopeptide transport system ATP-binding protein